jgi:lipopolysaccharide transport system ATP-binding protein
MQGDAQSALNSYHDLLRQRTDARAASLPVSAVETDLSTKRGVRQGTLEAAITSVDLLDLQGQPAEKIESGDGLVVRLHYKLLQPIHDMALLVGIFNDNHMKCFEAAIPSTASTFGTLSPEGTITCTLKSLPLLRGQYFVNVGLYPTNWSVIYDYHWEMHVFVVAATERPHVHRTGVVALETTWASDNGRGS